MHETLFQRNRGSSATVTCVLGVTCASSATVRGRNIFSTRAIMSLRARAQSYTAISNELKAASSSQVISFAARLLGLAHQLGTRPGVCRRRRRRARTCSHEHGRHSRYPFFRNTIPDWIVSGRRARFIARSTMDGADEFMGFFCRCGKHPRLERGRDRVCRAFCAVFECGEFFHDSEQENEEDSQFLVVRKSFWH